MSSGAEVMLQPPAVKLALYAGDGAMIRVILDNVMGVRIPVSGSVTAQIRASRTDPAVLQSFSVDLSGAASGVIVLGISGAQTAALAGSGDFIGVWDVQNTPPGSEVRTVVQGKVVVKQDVTH